MTSHHHHNCTVRRVSGSENPRGFTLVELMVALVVISILGGMVTIAVRSSQQTAKRVATEGLIRRIDSVLRSKWDEYRFRPLSVQMDNSTNLYDPSISPPQFLPEEIGRLRLMMLRDLMRMEMPDRMSDLTGYSIGDPNVTNHVLRATTPIRGRAVVYTRDSSGAIAETFFARPVLWTPPSQYANYFSRIPTTWTREHESAECLYLILSTTTVNGISALDVIAPAQIQDTDGDGMAEVVDSWGFPISWIRWPAGSTHRTIDPTVEDEFDLLGSDWGILRDNVEKPYSLTPQVISPGPDGLLGIATTEDTHLPVPYSAMTWPVNQTEAGTPLNEPYFYIDPFLRNYTQGINTGLPGGPPTPDHTLRPGARLSGGEDVAADNISSYDL